MVKDLEVGSALFARYRLWLFYLGVVLAEHRAPSSCLDLLKYLNPCAELLEEAEVAAELCLVEFQFHSALRLSVLEPQEMLLLLPSLAALECNWQ